MRRFTVAAILSCLLALQLVAGLVLASAAATLDCTSFVAQEDAQSVFDANPGDRFGLDPDGDGIACDELPTRGGSPPDEPRPPEPNEHEAHVIPSGATPAVVVKVIDGDTVTVQIGSKPETVRLIGIDAPEIKDPAQPVECFGAEATLRARELLAEGTTAYLEAEDAGRDGDGRLLRYVWIEGENDGDARLINALLLRGGYAVVTDPPGQRHRDRLQTAQDRAVKDQAGLWSACGGPGQPLAEIPRESAASSFEDPLTVDVDLFWNQTFASVARRYQPPAGVVAFDEAIDTACGRATWLDAAFYCTLDQTIYYNNEFRLLIAEQAGEFAWSTVLAHEWGHHVQDLLTIDASGRANLAGGEYSITVELQADCLAGVYARDAEARGWIDPSELEVAEALLGAIGDPSSVRWHDPGAHGASDQRLRSFRLGYAEGLPGCEITL